MYVCVVYFRPEFAKFKQEEISNVTRTYIKNANVAAVIRLTRTTAKAQRKRRPLLKSL